MFRTAAGRGVLVPFVMLGDSSPEVTLAATDALAEAGADALELGIPFSDPVADGPVVQRAAERALAAGTTPGLCFEMIAEIRRRRPELPLGILAYANSVARRGMEAFYDAAAHAGADSVLVADVPAVECAPFAAAARAAGIAPVLVIPPAAPAELVERVAGLGRGYTYLQGRPGVTGAGTPMAVPDAVLIARLAASGAPPPLIGFGVSRREHVETARRTGAAGVIVGSAIVEIIERAADDCEEMAALLTAMLHKLQAPVALGH